MPSRTTVPATRYEYSCEWGCGFKDKVKKVVIEHEKECYRRAYEVVPAYFTDSQEGKVAFIVLKELLRSHGVILDGGEDTEDASTVEGGNAFAGFNEIIKSENFREMASKEFQNLKEQVMGKLMELKEGNQEK